MLAWLKRKRHKRSKKGADYKFKQVIVVRTDLGMSKGKIAAQVAHGAVRAALRADGDYVTEWLNTGEAKIVLKVDGEAQLTALTALADLVGFPNALIWDEGLTEIKPGYTVLAIGPAEREKIDLLTGGLKTL